MTVQYRPMIQILREALQTLQSDPGPMTPEKQQLMSYLRERIDADLTRSTPLKPRSSIALD